MSHKTLKLCRYCRLERVLLDTLNNHRVPGELIYQCELTETYPGGHIRMSLAYGELGGYRIIAYLPAKVTIDVTVSEIQYTQKTGFTIQLNAADAQALREYRKTFGGWVSEMFDHLLATAVDTKPANQRIIHRLRAITMGWESTPEDKETLLYESSLLGGVAIDGLFTVRVKGVNRIAIEYRIARTIGSYLQPKRTKAKLAILQRTLRQDHLYGIMMPIYETRLVRPAEYFRLMKTLHDKDGLDIVVVTPHQ